MNAPVKTNYWAEELQSEFLPVERLIREARIYMELAELDIDRGEDLTGIRNYQRMRLEAAMDDVQAEREAS